MKEYIKSDVIIAKNYLDEKQIKRLERTVSEYMVIDLIVKKIRIRKIYKIFKVGGNNE